ncbi:MAG: LacI family DNA-binding transcriptional regulator, partial [Acidimicrobiia bacterium]
MTMRSINNPPNRRPTLRDVAKEAGTSVTTVSRVINNEDGVSPALLKR